MNDPKVVEFRTLTPLWTGGAERNSSHMRESGLMGSLRWWYEGIIRGLGGLACDPTQPTCHFDADKYDNAICQGQKGAKLLCEAGLCLACQFFGATGWQRRFRLEVKGLSPQPLFFSASKNVYQASGNWLWRMFGGDSTGGTKLGRGANVKFTFGTQALWAEAARLHIVPLGINVENTLARVAFLFDTVARCGGVGSKTQNGFGQIEITRGLDQDFMKKGEQLLRDDVEKTKEIRPNPSDKMFSMNTFFSRTYEVSGTESYCNNLREIGMTWSDNYRNYFIPCAYDIRYKSEQKNPFTGQGRDFGMRPWFRKRWGKSVTHILFGRSDAPSDDQRSAGRIRVSHLYRLQPHGPWHLKVWGYVPPGLQSDDRSRHGLGGIVSDVDEFIRGNNGMFPGSRLVREYKRKEVLGQ